MPCSTLVTVDELEAGITTEEYHNFLESQRKKAYINEATEENGVPVDVDDYILRGAEILISVSKESDLYELPCD